MAENQTSFKKGISGNPNGRPKSGNSWKDILNDATNQTEDDKTIKEIIAEVLIKKAKKGDLKAIEIIMNRQDGKPRQSVQSETESEIVIKLDHEKEANV